MLQIILLTLATALLLFLFLGFFRRSMGACFRLVLANLVFGVGTLLAFGFWGQGLGVVLPVNAATICLSGLLGLPGTLFHVAVATLLLA